MEVGSRPTTACDGYRVVAAAASTRSYLRLPKGLVGFWKGYYIYKRCRRFVVFPEFKCWLVDWYFVWKLILNKSGYCRSFISRLAVCSLVIVPLQEPKPCYKTERFSILFADMFNFLVTGSNVLLLCGQDIFGNKDLNSILMSYSVVLLLLFISFNR